ncbi:MAG: HAD family hydrolase [Bacillota bacterium]|nr:MAG: HAD family hydrolase [Bacillota bacterium]
MSDRISAVLFDLDGTLLRIEVEAFFPDYFSRLASHLAGYIPPPEFTPRLMKATHAMINDRDPFRTNREVFMEDFFAGLDHSQETLLPVFDAFYRDEFPKLSTHATPAEGAREAVEAVMAQGRRVVVATAPVFPRAAIDERLRWAGLQDVAFALVTSYENMHFCKPHPEYYDEIARQLGCRPSECLMVGNDVEEDLAAADAGMLTFLAGPEIIHRGKRPMAPHYRGTLEDLSALLESLG